MRRPPLPLPLHAAISSARLPTLATPLIACCALCCPPLFAVLGYSYVVVGVVCVVLALCFFIKQRLTQRHLADAEFISGPGR